MNIKGFFISLFLLLLLLNAFCQPKHANTQDQLSIICKSWGLVKYHHPNVQTGDFNLDEGLINMIDKIETDTSANVNDLILEWIHSLGPTDGDESTKKASDIHFERNHDISWLENTELLESDLVGLLYDLTHLRTGEKKYYVRKNSPIGNIEILNEKKYNIKDINYKNIRLLILFRYWNIIEYFFPYKYLMDKDWDSVLREYMPIFIKANSELDFQLAFLSLTVELNDSHANFFTEDILQFFGKKYLPVYFEMAHDQVVVSGYYHEEYARKNNLLKGDVIITSDSVSVNDRIEKLSKYTPGSNEARIGYNYRYSLFNGKEDSTNIVIVRDNDTIRQNVKRYSYEEFDIKPPSMSKWEVLGDGILLIRLWMISGKDINEIKKLLKKNTGLILDLRIYPKFNIRHRIVEIIKKRDSHFFKKIEPDLISPGKYVFKDNIKISGPKGSYQFGGNVAVLVNKRTISYGEFIVMELQSCENVTVIGSQTAGAVGHMSTLEVLEGMHTSFTGTGIYYPDSSEVQRSGVKIDLEVEPSLNGIKNGEDEILNMALKFLSKNHKENK